MKKHLAFVFLIGLTPFSFLSSTRAMDRDQEEEIFSNSTLIPQRYKYIVSLDENGKPLSNCQLRMQHPINNVIHFGNLDSKLYHTTIDQTQLKYNSSLEEVKNILEKLKQLAGNHLKSGIDVWPHLFLAACSFLDGRNGLEQDRKYGLDLMNWYLEKKIIPFPEFYQDNLIKFSKDPTYTMGLFIEEFREFREKAKARESHPKFLFLF